MFTDSRFASIGPIYYEYGSMVITFESSNTAVYAYELLRQATYEEKQLLGKLIMRNCCPTFFARRQPFSSRRVFVSCPAIYAAILNENSPHFLAPICLYER